MKKKELEAECERLEKELEEAKIEAQICREGFSGLRDLCVANGFMVVPNLRDYQPLRATMESLRGMKAEIKRRLDEAYNRPKG